MSFVNLLELATFSPQKMTKQNFFDCPQMVADVYALEPGQAQKIHSHAGEAKLYCVLAGRGEFTIGDAVCELGPGQAVGAAAGVPHGVANHTNERLTVLAVLAPNPNQRPAT